MLPYYQFIIDNLKKEITREEAEHLKTQLLNIDSHKASETEEQAENHPLVQEL